eukprot:Seg3900.1 transcript_id=Seg3900.1/GoldUCD/mRNA.D3Y31 product="ATP synthase mitochondrial F1 complex assembly factor 1" protein_id=Seg3900.1/GoldUCD/D3Y31
MEKLKSNPFYQKYAEKIEMTKMKCAKPTESINEPYHMQNETKMWKKSMIELEQKMESNENPLSSEKSGLPKKLDDILKLEQIIDKDADEVGKIWTEYFKTKQSISAFIPGKSFDKVYTRSLSCPAFIYPLVKDQGYEFMLGQFRDKICFFTSLLNYQVHGENAPWHLNIAHYTELKEEKDIVLMLGEFDKNKMNVLEAQCLAQQVQMFYATSDEERFNLVHVFNKAPNKFKYMDVIKEVEASRLIENLQSLQ